MSVCLISPNFCGGNFTLAYMRESLPTFGTKTPPQQTPDGTEEFIRFHPIWVTPAFMTSITTQFSTVVVALRDPLLSMNSCDRRTLPLGYSLNQLIVLAAFPGQENWFHFPVDLEEAKSPGQRLPTLNALADHISGTKLHANTWATTWPPIKRKQIRVPVETQAMTDLLQSKELLIRPYLESHGYIGLSWYT